MELLRELFRFRRYKVSQGHLIRRMTMAGVWVLFATAAWKCTQMDYTWIGSWAIWFGISAETTRDFVVVFPYSMAGLILLFGIWFGWRVINWITFADFLIAVEAEMAKVSWPGRAELRSSTIVVLTVFLLLAGMIYLFDLTLVFIFGLIGVM